MAKTHGAGHGHSQAAGKKHKDEKHKHKKKKHQKKKKKTQAAKETHRSHQKKTCTEAVLFGVLSVLIFTVLDYTDATDAVDTVDAGEEHDPDGREEQLELLGVRFVIGVTLFFLTRLGLSMAVDIAGEHPLFSLSSIQSSGSLKNSFDI